MSSIEFVQLYPAGAGLHASGKFQMIAMPVLCLYQQINDGRSLPRFFVGVQHQYDPVPQMSGTVLGDNDNLLTDPLVVCQDLRTNPH